MAATVSISLLNVAGESLATTIYFTSLSTPTIASASIVIGKTTTAYTNDSGAGTVSLQAGDYLVKILDERFKISVPSSSGSYALADLVTSDLVWTIGSNWRSKNGSLQLLNESDSLYYTLGCKNVDGVAVLYLADTGEA